jgi:hypothetical protein
VRFFRAFIVSIKTSKRPYKSYIISLVPQDSRQPTFFLFQLSSYRRHTKLIQFFDEENHLIALRIDSTLDIVWIVLRRLSRTTDHKKWFYIQPVFSYHTNEHY